MHKHGSIPDPHTAHSMETAVSDFNRRKQIIYRANHRGIKEMDIILGGFADANVMRMDGEMLGRFEAIMAESDRDLLSWFTGEQMKPDYLDKELFDSILAHTIADPRN